MYLSSNPGPDDHDALSAWERRVLADIENDLTLSDPRLADAMSRPAVRAERWWPLSGPSTGLLIVALTVLVLVAALLPASWRSTLGLVTTLVVIPWLLMVVTEKGGST
jgi:Protein of unknown function (DUF3040)